MPNKLYRLTKRVFWKLIPNNDRKQFTNFRILSHKYGQYNTIKLWSCVDANMNPIPWYTYPAIEYLNNIDFSQKIIFEYGCGNSSLYWGKRAKLVVSVEHDRDWYEKIIAKMEKNQVLLLKDKSSEYENAINLPLEGKCKQAIRYDLIVLDGIRRKECARVIKNNLNMESDEGCMVILDNSDWHKNTAKYLRDELDLIQFDFHGFSPINAYTLTTSVFVSRNYSFKPIGDVQPVFSIGAIKHYSD